MSGSSSSRLTCVCSQDESRDVRGEAEICQCFSKPLLASGFLLPTLVKANPKLTPESEWKGRASTGPKAWTLRGHQLCPRCHQSSILPSHASHMQHILIVITSPSIRRDVRVLGFISILDVAPQMLLHLNHGLMIKRRVICSSHNNLVVRQSKDNAINVPAQKKQNGCRKCGALKTFPEIVGHFP